MHATEGLKLSQGILRKMEEMVTLCRELDEETFLRAPSGRWSPKQIIAHLSGPDGVGFMPAIRSFLEQDIPRIDIEAENPYFTERRAGMTGAELLTEFRKEYLRITDYTAGLSDTQLARTAYIPLFKETPMGEYPTLAAFLSALGEYHMDFHINHMREIVLALKTAGRG